MAIVASDSSQCIEKCFVTISWISFTNQFFIGKSFLGSRQDIASHRNIEHGSYGNVEG